MEDLESMRSERLIAMSGRHGVFFGADSECSQKYEQFLQKCDLMGPVVTRVAGAVTVHSTRRRMIDVQEITGGPPTGKWSPTKYGRS